MTTMIATRDVRTITLGISVSRASSVVAQQLTPMFTITGGKIIVKALYAELTVASDASNATTIVLGFTAALGGGANIPNCLASSTVVGVVKEIGTHWMLHATTIGGALQIGQGAAPATTPLQRHPEFLLGAGTITYTGGVGVNPASPAWCLVYTPLDVGVVVAAA